MNKKPICWLMMLSLAMALPAFSEDAPPARAADAGGAPRGSGVLTPSWMSAT